MFFLYTLLSLSGNSGRLRLQQPQEQRYPVLKVHTGYFRVSIIHRTLTWTTGSLTCVRNHSYACVCNTRGWGIPTASQHTIFVSEKLSHMFIVLLTQAGFKPPVFGSRVRRSTHWATPSPLMCLANCNKKKKCEHLLVWPKGLVIWCGLGNTVSVSSVYWCHIKACLDKQALDIIFPATQRMT